jgi:hypothetical protein
VSNIAVSCSNNFNNGIVQGNYKVVAYDAAGQVDSVSTVIFDGLGGVSGSAIQNHAGVIANSSVFGTYTVAGPSQGSASASTLATLQNTGMIVNFNGAAALTGFTSGHGDTFVLSQLTAGQDPGIAVGIRQPQSGFTNGNLNGTFTVVGYGGVAGTGTVATLSFDGAGTFSGTAVQNSAGGLSTSGLTGTYAVAGDGTVTVTPAGAAPLTGAVSYVDDELVLVQATPGQSPAIMVGVEYGQSSVANSEASAEYGVASYRNSGGMGTLIFNGTMVSGPIVQNSGGVISSGINFLGTYAPNADGLFTLDQTAGASFTGGVSLSGALLVAGDIAAGQAADIQIGVPVSIGSVGEGQLLSPNLVRFACGPMPTASNFGCTQSEQGFILANTGRYTEYQFGSFLPGAPNWLTVSNHCNYRLLTGQSCVIDLAIDLTLLPRAAGGYYSGTLITLVSADDDVQTATSLLTNWSVAVN